MIIQNGLTPLWNLTGEVLEIDKYGRSYIIVLPDGSKIRRNRRFLRPFEKDNMDSADEGQDARRLVSGLEKDEFDEAILRQIRDELRLSPLIAPESEFPPLPFEKVNSQDSTPCPSPPISTPVPEFQLAEPDYVLRSGQVVSTRPLQDGAEESQRPIRARPLDFDQRIDECEDFVRGLIDAGILRRDPHPDDGNGSDHVSGGGDDPPGTPSDDRDRGDCGHMLQAAEMHVAFVSPPQGLSSTPASVLRDVAARDSDDSAIGSSAGALPANGSPFCDGHTVFRMRGQALRIGSDLAAVLLDHGNYARISLPWGPPTWLFWGEPEPRAHDDAHE